MRKLLPLLIVGVVGFAAYQRAHQSSPAIPPGATEFELQVSQTQFQCDGRTRCSQMTSCAEATYFLKNCPGVKMDGDNDGLACEDQFCGH
jgi:hypothetical protein